MRQTFVKVISTIIEKLEFYSSEQTGGDLLLRGSVLVKIHLSEIMFKI